MIIDAHAHYTTAPPELQAYRGRQIMNLANPPRPRLQISDEQLERSMAQPVQAHAGQWDRPLHVFAPSLRHGASLWLRADQPVLDGSL